MKRSSRQPSHLDPGWVLILYYGVAILLGGILLTLPISAQGEPLSFIDALFTATSAQCVTGLIVVDTGTKLTLFGQGVVLLLIQIGGLGITTFSVYLFFYLGKGVGIRDRWVIQETLLHTPVDSLRDLVHSIFKYTLVIEGVGAALLAIAFVPKMGWVKGIYSAVFHSISAFCNAGFSLFPDSLIGYRADPLVNITIMALIILGGIGFLVIKEVFDLSQEHNRRRRRRLSLHSRLVFMTTAILIIGGALLIGLLEAPSAFASMNLGESIWVSLFQSVTARTAGFNSIDLNLFEVPTLFVIIFLMFVGASPGSCGGGIKTTSLALFVAIMHSRLKGNPHTNVFRRALPEAAVTKTLTLVMTALLFLAFAIFVLLAVQLQGMPAITSRGVFLDYTFEAVSAFATVGLSLGATTKLVPAGKLIVIILMFIGRVGLLTVAFTMIRRSREGAVHYAEENIMIG